MGKRTISKLNVKFLANYALLSQIIFVLALIGGIAAVATSFSVANLLYTLFSVLGAFIQMVIASNIALMAEQIEVIKDEIIEQKMGISLAEYSDENSDSFNNRQDIDRWIAGEDVPGQEIIGEELEFSEEELIEEAADMLTPESELDIEDWLNG